MKKIAGLEIHVHKKDNNYEGFVRSGEYQSQTFFCYGITDEREAQRKVLKSWLEGPAVELALLKQLWFTFNEELTA